MQDFLTSIVRTVVPFIVGAVISWLTTKGLHVSSDVVASATGYLTVLFGAGYYVAVRALEKKWPKLGYFLGIPSEPIY